jgi:hypothetical protein
MMKMMKKGKNGVKWSDEEDEMGWKGYLAVAIVTLLVVIFFYLLFYWLYVGMA